jgi:hypothetical protein
MGVVKTTGRGAARPTVGLSSGPRGKNVRWRNWWRRVHRGSVVIWAAVVASVALAARATVTKRAPAVDAKGGELS